MLRYKHMTPAIQVMVVYRKQIVFMIFLSNFLQ